MAALEQEFTQRKTDHRSAVRRQPRGGGANFAGVGGLDAQDFGGHAGADVSTLGGEVGDADTLECSTNDDAGIKTAVLEISGPFAYGNW